MKKITLTCTALVALFAANVGAAGSTKEGENKYPPQQN